MITTIDMEIRLMQHFGIVRNLIVPTVSGDFGFLSFEADLVVLSPAGYATVVEIKISKADLKNDLKKSHIARLSETKLNSGKTPKEFYYKKIKRFYYAVPDFLKKEALSQIPDFAGLLVLTEGVGGIQVKEVRKAQIISNFHWSDKQRYELARLGAMRILNLKIRNRELFREKLQR